MTEGPGQEKREKQGPKPLIPSAGTGRKKEDTVKAEGQGPWGKGDRGYCSLGAERRHTDSDAHAS